MELVADLDDAEVAGGRGAAQLQLQPVRAQLGGHVFFVWADLLRWGRSPQASTPPKKAEKSRIFVSYDFRQIRHFSLPPFQSAPILRAPLRLRLE